MEPSQYPYRGVFNSLQSLSSVVVFSTICNSDSVVAQAQ